MDSIFDTLARTLAKNLDTLMNCLSCVALSVHVCELLHSKSSLICFNQNFKVTSHIVGAPEVGGTLSWESLDFCEAFRICCATLLSPLKSLTKLLYHSITVAAQVISIVWFLPSGCKQSTLLIMRFDTKVSIIGLLHSPKTWKRIGCAIQCGSMQPANDSPPGALIPGVW